jgi:hypothetical protein
MNYFDAVKANPFNNNVVWISLSNTSGYSELISANIGDLTNVQVENITLPDNGFIRGIQFDPQNEGHVLITIGTRVYRTEDYGNTWILSNAGLEQLIPGYDLILNVDSNPFNSQHLAVATNKGIFSSVDGGSTWNQIYTELVHQVFYSNSSEGYMVGTIHSSGVSDYAIVFTTDGGQNWTRIENEELSSVGSTSSKVKFNGSSNAEIYISTIDLGLVKYVLDFQALGINEPEIDDNIIKVFPNPVSDTLTINSSNSEVESFSLFDITGKLIVETFGQNKIDVSNLPQGVYLLKVNVNSGKSFSKKIIKM